MKVAILGGGPSGMMAAWASIQCGHEVSVFDRDPLSISVGSNHGVFALWDDCDLFLSQKQEVKIGVIGAKALDAQQTEEAYAMKVYGFPQADVSISKYTTSEYRTTYNHAEAYQQIIDILGRDSIYQFDFIDLVQAGEYFSSFDLVINTLPATLVLSSALWPSSYAYIYHSEAPDDDAFMIYNVNPSIPWSRCSAIFGYFSMEYPTKPLGDRKYVRVKKVMDGPDPEEMLVEMGLENWWCTGRYGAWSKDMLTETVYWATVRRLTEKPNDNSRAIRSPSTAAT